ncbi:location of vulva defective 1 [Plakobranchus ocellatus]|uniref:Location of vulva defective 1 n=1 Tax=Plakobranchus ocellatus TaxID=259542 RepID=A0AAV3ZM78_9GAST|nr:location of vulva defective 1 [Plakobranchus ocellatus]
MTRLGNDLNYQVDYADGAGYTAKNETGFESRDILLPGTHTIAVLVSDTNGMYTPLNTAVGIKLTEPPAEVEVLCDPVMVTFEEGQCEVTVWKGSDLSMNVSITSKPTADVMNVRVSDPDQNLIGYWSATATAVVYPGTNAVYLLQEAMFPSKGRVYSLRTHVSSMGTLKLLILSPVCANSYCYESNRCQVSCLYSVAGTLNHQCGGGDNGFCVGTTMCDPTCAAAAARFGTTTVLGRS